MIILFHGTGDDDSKDENWMKWVTILMRHAGESVLCLPGVGSGQQEAVCAFGQSFLEALMGEGNARNVIAPMAIPDGLRDSMNAAASDGSELHPIIKQVWPTPMDELASIHAAQRAEGGTNAIGIKTRAAVAAVCARAYKRWAAEPMPIRMIGHSRGGSAAIATHNVLRWMGIADVETLALDPCHGVKKATIKEYTSVVYSGKVRNIPAVKEVGTGSTWAYYTNRARITVGEGADAGTTVVNNDPLETIEHGHMGKLTSLPKPGKMDGFKAVFGGGSKAKKIANKAARQEDIRNAVTELEAGDLKGLFDMAEDKHGDLADKQFVHRAALDLLVPDWDVIWQENPMFAGR